MFQYATSSEDSRCVTDHRDNKLSSIQFQGWSGCTCAHHVCLDQAHLEGPASVLDGGDGRGTSAAIVAADLDDVCVCLCDARSHSPDAGLGHQLHADLG